MRTEQRPVRPLSLAVYALMTGLGLGLALFVWHVTGDNAYLYAYFIALILLVTGCIASLLALSRTWGLPKAVATLVLAAAVSVAVLGPALSEVLAGPLGAGGDSSQSPCLAEARARRPSVSSQEPPGYQPPSATQLDTNARRAMVGGLMQLLVPFFSGVIPLSLAILRRRPDRSVLLRGLAPAAAVTAYIYLRGPGAWCGQLIGLDGLIAIVLGVLWAVSRLDLSARLARRRSAA